VLSRFKQLLEKNLLELGFNVKKADRIEDKIRVPVLFG